MIWCCSRNSNSFSVCFVPSHTTFNHFWTGLMRRTRLCIIIIYIYAMQRVFESLRKVNFHSLKSTWKTFAFWQIALANVILFRFKTEWVLCKRIDLIKLNVFIIVCQPNVIGKMLCIVQNVWLWSQPIFICSVLIIVIRFVITAAWASNRMFITQHHLCMYGNVIYIYNLM